MKVSWRTAWQGQDIVVYRDDVECDRLAAAQIRRIVFVYSGAGDTPGDLHGSLVRLTDEWMLLPADTGFAGRVHFERLTFWGEHACQFWVSDARARLPWRLRRGPWWLHRSAEPAFARVPADALDALVDAWPLEGPLTWEQRKRRRIEAARPFAALSERLRM
jgi:hypothetical protein